MSQNTHSLLLLFNDAAQFQRWRSLLQKLDDGADTAQPNPAAFDEALRREWQENWFNHSFATGPGYLMLRYDTSVHYELPVDALEELFDGGLAAAVLEIFYDQAGETRRYHFLDSKLVNREALYKAHPRVPTLAAAEFADEDDIEHQQVDKPIPLRKLRVDEEQRTADAQKMVEALVDIAKVSRESGVNPLQVMRSALIMRALVVGLLKALAFTVVTVLLFKGIWLWILLGLVLAVVLPLFGALKVLKDFGPLEGDDDQAETASDAD